MLNIDIPKRKVFSGDRPLFKEKNIRLELPEFLECRSSVWNSFNLKFVDCIMQGPKF